MEDKTKETKEAPKGDPRLQASAFKAVKELKKNAVITKKYKEWLKGNINA